jgi:hypothetical protein
MMMSSPAVIALYPAQFRIVGPPALVALTQAIVFDQSLSPLEVQSMLNEAWRDWHVDCSVSGEPILLCELRYWDVAQQKVYARPQLIPQLR